MKREIEDRITQVTEANNATAEALAKLAQAEQQARARRTLINVTCGHALNDPLFAIIDEVESGHRLAQRVAELEAALLGAQADLCEDSPAYHRITALLAGREPPR